LGRVIWQRAGESRLGLRHQSLHQLGLRPEVVVDNAAAEPASFTDLASDVCSAPGATVSSIPRRRLRAAPVRPWKRELPCPRRRPRRPQLRLPAQTPGQTGRAGHR
jgi:hypothetical protein